MFARYIIIIPSVSEASKIRYNDKIKKNECSLIVRVTAKIRFRIRKFGSSVCGLYIYILPLQEDNLIFIKNILIAAVILR